MANNISEHTKWIVIDSHWCCIYRNFIQDKTELVADPYFGTLAEYLWMLGFDIPDTIKYCIAENDRYRLKFRFDCGTISIYVNEI